MNLASDLRFALRYFSRHKASTAVLVAVLALATGANTLIFTLFQAQFLRPAPQVPQDPAHALVWMQERPTPTARWKLIQLSGTQLQQLGERRETFASVAAWVDEKAIVSGGDSAGARNAPITFVTPNFLATLGVPVTQGRDLLPRPDGSADLSAVIAEVAAEQMFGSAPAALGERLLVNRVPVEIVGVAPRRFRGATRDDVEPLLFLPLSARSDLMQLPARWMDDPADGSLSVFARLAANVSFEQATAAAQQIAVATLPDSAQRVGMTRMAEVRHLGALPPWEEGEELVLIFTLLALLGVLILLVGWMNVSSLMVAAAVARRQEIAVRLALGATRLRIIRQLAIESTMVSMAGASVGAVAAFWLLSIVSSRVVTGSTLTPDAKTIAFVVALAVVTGILFGLSPALHATRGVAGALRDSGHGASRRSRLQRALVVAQIAFSQPLLVALLVMLRMVMAGYQPLAPETSRVVVEATFKPSLDPTLADLGPAQVETLAPQLAARPEVRGVVPGAMAFDVRSVRVPNDARRDSIPALVHLYGSAPGWFVALDVPIVLGRDLLLSDSASTDHPVVIGVDLARALYGDANPIGRILDSPALDGDDALKMTVVGVYDSRVVVPGMPSPGSGARGETPFRVYTAHGKAWRQDQLLIRTRGPAAEQLGELQRFVIAEAAQLPIAAMQTLEQRDEQGRQATLRLAVAAGFGALLALALASLGLYGVIAFSVRQRTREIGIRIAVGAEPGQVSRMFLRSGLRSALLGLAIGLPLTLAILQVLIAQGEMRMPGTLPVLVGTVVALLMLSVAALATWIPARSAARVDPGLTLRAE